MVFALSSAFVATAARRLAPLLPALAPLAGPPVGAQASEVQRMAFKTEDRQELVASFYAPRKSDSLAPAAILVHDRGGSRADLDALAQRLSKQGFAVLVPDLRGHGESAQGGIDWKTLDEKERDSLWAFATRDITASAKHLAELEGVHTANLSILGLGAGALLATHHAVRDESVRSLALIRPTLVEPGAERASFCTTTTDLESLGGLPTFIVIDREAHGDTKRLCEAAMQKEGRGGSIEILVARCEGAEILSDQRVPLTVSKWLMDQARPKRGADR